MSNYGDQLYPTIFRALFGELAPEIATEWFGLIEGADGDGFPVEASSSSRLSDAHAVLVSGGDLIRTDRRTVAHDHLQVALNRRTKVRERLKAERFVASRMRGRAIPFIPPLSAI